MLNVGLERQVTLYDYAIEYMGFCVFIIPKHGGEIGFEVRDESNDYVRCFDYLNEAIEYIENLDRNGL